VCKDDVMISIL